MKVRERPLEDIRPYARNPRKNDAAVEKVMASLKEFGWRQPIVVDSEMVIVAGHTRHEAARRLGWTTAPVHVAENLTPAQVNAYRLADNRSGEFSEWDTDKLLQELEALEGVFSAEHLGFAIEEYDPQDLALREWDFSEVQDECIVTVRGPLQAQAEIRARLRDLEGLTIEASHIARP